MAKKTAQVPAPKILKKTKFLVYIDNQENSKTALRFACHKAAMAKCPVEMLYVLEPADFVGIGGVEEMMRVERREKAEKVLNEMAGEVNRYSGITPSLIVREGAPEEQILASLKEDNNIGVLVVGAGAGGDNRMLSWLVSGIGDKLQIPVMAVPGNLTEEQIIELT